MFLWQYMKVRVSPNLLQFIRSYLRDFWGKVKRSSGQSGRVHTAGDSDLSLRSEQKDDVCSSVSVDLTLFKWHKRAAGLRRICRNLIWFALQTSHFGFGSNLQKLLHILCFFLPKINLDMLKKHIIRKTMSCDAGRHVSPGSPSSSSEIFV